MKEYVINSKLLGQRVIVTEKFPGCIEAECADGVRYTSPECLLLTQHPGALSPTIHALKKWFNGEIDDIKDIRRW